MKTESFISIVFLLFAIELLADAEQDNDDSCAGNDKRCINRFQIF